MVFTNEVVSNEVERLWKEAVMSLFDVQSRFLSEGTGEKYGQRQAGYHGSIPSKDKSFSRLQSFHTSSGAHRASIQRVPWSNRLEHEADRPPEVKNTYLNSFLCLHDMVQTRDREDFT
jgi:hypothetical protein